MAEEIGKNNSPDGLFGPIRDPRIRILTDRRPQESVYHSVGPLGVRQMARPVRNRFRPLRVVRRPSGRSAKDGVTERRRPPASAGGTHALVALVEIGLHA